MLELTFQSMISENFLCFYINIYQHFKIQRAHVCTDCTNKRARSRKQLHLKGIHFLKT